MNFLMVSCILIIVVIVGGAAIARHLEKRDYNEGVCPICNGKLYNFDTDSQGGRGYKCDHCDYITWVSYNVDKCVNKT